MWADARSAPYSLGVLLIAHSCMFGEFACSWSVDLMLPIEILGIS